MIPPVRLAPLPPEGDDILAAGRPLLDVPEGGARQLHRL